MSHQPENITKEIFKTQSKDEKNKPNRSQKEIYNEAKKRYKIIPKEEIPEFIYVPPIITNSFYIVENEREE